MMILNQLSDKDFPDTWNEVYRMLRREIESVKYGYKDDGDYLDLLREMKAEVRAHFVRVRKALS